MCYAMDALNSYDTLKAQVEATRRMLNVWETKANILDSRGFRSDADKIRVFTEPLRAIVGK